MLFQLRSDRNGVATTYSAPTTPPGSDLAVTITATSVSNNSASNFAAVIVHAVSTSIRSERSRYHLFGPDDSARQRPSSDNHRHLSIQQLGIQLCRRDRACCFNFDQIGTESLPPIRPRRLRPAAT